VVTDEGRARVLEVIVREQIRADDEPGTIGWLQRLSRAAAAALPADGVGVSMMADARDQFAVAASSELHAEVEELQFTLGEGPCLAAYESGGPVLVPDIAEAARTRWPGYGAAVLQYDVRAVFAFPLQVGAARLGALDVYQATPGPMPGRAVVDALTFAEVALTRLLDTQQRSEETGDPFVDHLVDESHAELYQAQGMVMVQLGVGLREAMARLRAYAYAQDRLLSEVAADVVAHRIMFKGDDA
jgi:GAF domain-containing protein